MEQLSNQELRGMTPEQLVGKIAEFRRKLLELRLNAATNHVKSFPTEQKALKRAVARVLTHLREKELADSKEV
jgi:ribosomal protein L29